MTDEWRISRFQDPEGEYEDNLFNVQVIDAVNRFGRKAVAYIDDVDGNRKDKYQRGLGVEFEVKPSGTSEWLRRFAGMVIEPRESERNGADIVEVEVYSFDYFLRQNTIERDFSGESFFDALEEVIQDFTPVKWVPENVQVVNDDALTRGYRGEKVDEFLNEISSKSANETYGVNNDLEFFFRPQEFGESGRNIDNTQWIDYDFPEEGKRTVNELQLFYGSGGEEGSVIVDDGPDKLSLKNSLGLDGPGVLREEVTYEEIDNEADARDKAEEILNRKSSIERGEVTTYGLFETEPGDVITVRIDPVDIDDEFRVAEIEYDWAADETIVQLVEKADKDDERLVEITDTLRRVERRNANRDAIATRFVDTESGGLLQVSVSLITRESGTDRFNPGFGQDNLGFGRSVPGIHISEVIEQSATSTRVTNHLRDSVRDGWMGDGNPDISELAIGSGSNDPSRMDDSLESETDRVEAVPNPSEAHVRWDSTFTFDVETTVSEVGVFDNQTLHSRSVSDGVDVQPNTPIDISYRIESQNNPQETGVITTNGQNTIHDIIADDNPDLPTDMVFGGDDTSPDESDESLVNELITIPIDHFRERETGQVDVFGRLSEDDLEGETIAESGLTASGTLLTRSTFAEFTKEAQTDGEGGQEVENRERITWQNA